MIATIFRFPSTNEGATVDCPEPAEPMCDDCFEGAILADLEAIEDALLSALQSGALRKRPWSGANAAIRHALQHVDELTYVFAPSD